MFFKNIKSNVVSNYFFCTYGDRQFALFWGDLCKQEAAFRAGWILPEKNQEDIRTFYNHEPELEKIVT